MANIRQATRWLSLTFFSLGMLMQLKAASELNEDAYGICAHIQRWEYDRAVEELQLMRAAGISSVRWDMDWDMVEKRRGEWDFSRPDFLKEEAAKNGINILPILGYHTPWAQPAWDNIPEFLAYVEAVVRRYGDSMPYWEVWNEQDHHSAWGRKGAAGYTTFFKAVSERIKSVNPGLTIAYGGTLGPRVPFDFIKQTFEAGIGDAMDVMCIHPYSWQDSPETFQMADIARLRQLMDRYGAQGKPIWLTEVGNATHPDDARYWEYLLPQLLNEMEVDRENANFVLLCDSRYRYITSAEFAQPTNAEIGNANIQRIDFSGLRELKPAPNTVLIVAGNEAFPAKYHADLLDYVRHGGKLIFPAGLPLYYDLRIHDNWVDSVQINDRACPAFHLHWETAWSKKGVPAKTESYIWAKGDNPVIIGKHLTSFRFFTDEKLAGNDRFVPVLQGKTGEYIGTIAGVYHLDSELKGKIAVSGIVRETISEQKQAQVLPRTMLLAFAAGAERIFWYSFRSTEWDDGREANFGIIRRNLDKKAAFHAYQTLTSMYPPGSTGLSITESDDAFGKQTYVASWQKPNGENVQAIWTIDEEKYITGSGVIKEAVDYLGRSVKISNKEGGGLSFTIGPGITYIVNSPTFRVARDVP